METNDLIMKMKLRSKIPEKKERENKWVWSAWVKTALESCGIWSNQVKGGPLMKEAAEKDQTTKVKSEDQWGLETALESCGIWSNQVKGGPLMERASEEDQTAKVKSKDQLGLEDNTLLEKIEDVYGNKINLKRVYEVKKAICDLKQGKDELHQLVGRLKELWLELMARPEVVQERREQDVICCFLVN